MSGARGAFKVEKRSRAMKDSEAPAGEHSPQLLQRAADRQHGSKATDDDVEEEEGDVWQSAAALSS